jgi:hypothetical protein
MDDILREFYFRFVYLDDILLLSSSLEEYEQHIQALFAQLQRCGSIIKPVKFVFRVRESTFLGCMVSTESLPKQSY